MEAQQARKPTESSLTGFAILSLLIAILRLTTFFSLLLLASLGALILVP